MYGLKPEKFWEKIWGFEIGLGKKFLDLAPKAKIAKAKIKKQSDIKLKSFCTAKKTINKMKMQPIYGMGENTCKSHIQ